MERVIVGTGSCSAGDAIAISSEAMAAGANGLLMLPPFYYKNPSDDGLFAFFARVAEKLGERNPRIFLYHFPQMSATPITIGLMRRLRAEFPGIFVGLKDSSGDFANTLAFIEAFPGIEAYAGTEVFAARTIEAGGMGCISATANLSAPLVAERLGCTDKARCISLDEKIEAVRAAVSSLGNIAGTKGCLAAYRKDPEWARVLPPNLPIDDRAARELADRLDAIASIGSCFR